ncbi:uncharacterized protein K452DRAFT_51875 [Aplosporella prunicola CBS 121167]|uniref:Uncharacterized protein n=1 Tax=Aplosporella prunicola CBS 121167 TaxID=1176127 RepID=A0A6A6B9U3_9PEZI|nr:uncharacterized protein K452DRAFT_51875 [Aplosporella prunicola CBS 121167]KAF2140133.1 hypothetical protein K452DRAFT_51875 [Aplosporella prunicola CBS 121167]
MLPPGPVIPCHCQPSVSAKHCHTSRIPSLLRLKQDLQLSTVPVHCCFCYFVLACHSPPLCITTFFVFPSAPCFAAGLSLFRAHTTSMSLRIGRCVHMARHRRRRYLVTEHGS